MSAASIKFPRGRLQGMSVGAMLLEARAFLAFVAIFVIFSALAPHAFPTASNIVLMCQQVSIFAILAIGQLIVIMDAGIDLSVGSTLGLSGMVVALALKGFHVAGVMIYPSVWVAVTLALATGAFVGLINGLLVVRFKVAPFVATLGTMYMVRGIAALTTNGLSVNNLDGVPELGNTGFAWLGFNSVLGLPVGVWIMIAIAAIVSLMLNHTVYGRWLYAQGGNRRAAELSGVPVRRMSVSVYVIAGLCAAISGVILTSELTSAGTTAGTMYELTAIAAVVIGGASLFGGTGNIRGTLMGAFVIGFLAAGLTIVGISSYVQAVFTGAVIVLAVMLNNVEIHSSRPSAAKRKARKAAVVADES